jgi:hypothetical protein
MKTACFIYSLTFALHLFAAEPPNPQIDYQGFVNQAKEAEALREKNRISEEKFIEMSATPGTVILDARSLFRFQAIHIKGAIHLALTDFTEEALRKLIPDPETPILIYCNNNFSNEPENFPSKVVTVALNIQTFINLRAYGYKNIYELGPYLDVKTTKIPFEGSTIVK